MKFKSKKSEDTMKNKYIVITKNTDTDFPFKDLVDLANLEKIMTYEEFLNETDHFTTLARAKTWGQKSLKQGVPVIIAKIIYDTQAKLELKEVK
tara:strand:+ start:4360 stop:4641 length:282 start_codon:yes stop_codon:yes gene_type:complete